MEQGPTLKLGGFALMGGYRLYLSTIIFVQTAVTNPYHAAEKAATQCPSLPGPWLRQTPRSYPCSPLD